MKTKIVTIGQTAIACFPSKQDMEQWYEGPNDHTYKGPLSQAPHAKLAPLHPNFMPYWENALMVLYRGTNKLRGGTESPAMALADCLPDGTNFIIVWQPITHE